MGCDDRRRFELELEFLHCLANPGYLNCERAERRLESAAGCGSVAQKVGLPLLASCCKPTPSPVPAPPRAGLAQNRYLDDPAFLSYLQYLQYWLQPAYARFVV